MRYTMVLIGKMQVRCMGVALLHWLGNTVKLLIVMAVPVFFLEIKAAQILPEEESAVLGAFLRILFEDSQAGYVLFNQKPVCIHGYPERDLSCFNFSLHKQEVALKEGIRIWNKYEGNSENVKNCIHICRNEDPSIRGYRHLLIINKQMFHAVIKENLPLYQHVLGPSITSQMLFDFLALEDWPFHSLLKYDNVLVGNLLGYGLQNSLYASRAESIQKAMGEIIPPFLPGTAFTRKYREEYLPHLPSNGFQNLQEEFLKIDEKLDVSSEKLLGENPPFIFGWLKSLRTESNHKEYLVPKLEETQILIQKLLESPSFTEQALEMTTGKSFKTSYTNGFKFHIDDEKKNQILARGIWASIQCYDPCYYSPFIDGLSGLPPPKTKIDREAWNPNYPLEIRRAKDNLLNAEAFFQEIDSTGQSICIIPKKLYYRVIKLGNGKYKYGDFAKLTYSIFSPSGHCLAFQHDALINLKNTIRGFFLGVREMQIGETRELWIHPGLAYGYDTSLEKSIYLKAVVTLNDVPYLGESEKGLLNEENEEIDLKFLLDPKMDKTIIENCAAVALTNGANLRQLLIRDGSLDIAQIVGQLKGFLETKDVCSEPMAERDSLNKIFWNLYFSHK